MSRPIAVGLGLSCALALLLLEVTGHALGVTLDGDRYELAEPRWLMLLALLPITLASAHRSLADLPRAQLVLSGALRGLGIVLLALALAEPARTTDVTRTSVVFAIDVSDSITDRDLARAEDLVRAAIEARGENTIAVVSFAATSERVPVDLEDPASFHVARHEDGAASDLGGALRLALALHPEGHLGRIVVVSDGSETRSGALSELGTLSTRHVRALHVLLDDGPPAEIAVEDLVAPARLRVGEPFTLRARVRSTTAAHVRVRLYQNDLLNGLDGVREVDLPEGETEIALRSVVHLPGPVTYRFTVTPADEASDRFPENDELSRTLVVPGRPRVLYVEGQAAGATYLSRALESSELDVEVRSPRAFPTSLPELSAFDFLIVSDTPADAISPSQQELIERYVRDQGGGFLMAGGDQSFGLGGWEGSRVERLLPVHMDPERRRDQPSLALALVLDRSGSMAGEKIELAKEAARATAELLSGDDYLGVVSFDSQPERAVRMQSAGNRLQIQRDIGRIAARGGTAIFPALDMAFSDLTVTRARLRHVILLTDGQTNETGIPDLVSLMHAEGITVSVVGVGSDVNRALLQEVADTGGGRAYFTADPHNIPRIFTRETTTAMQSGVVEDYVTARVTAPAAFLRGVPMESAPLLRGYVATRMRAAPAEEILESDLGEPLLARMRVGLGWTLAWTSDVKNRWAVDWVRWPGFAPLFGQMVREHMRQRHEEELPMEARIEGETARLVVEAMDDEDAFVNDLDPVAHVIGPMGAPVDERTRIDVPMHQVAPGRYEGETPIERFGAYAITAEHRRGGAVVAESTGSLVYPYAPEYAALEPDPALLEALSEASGGGVYAEPADAFDAMGEHVRAREDARAPLFFAALAIFVLDLLTRRVRLFDRSFRAS